MRKLREWSKTFLYLDLLFSIAWYVVAAVFGALFLIVVVVRGDTEQIFPLLGTVVGSLAILAFAYWIARDARKAKSCANSGRRPSPCRMDTRAT